MTGTVYQKTGLIWLDTSVFGKHWITWKQAVLAFDAWSQVTSRREGEELLDPVSGIVRRETYEVCLWQVDEGSYAIEYLALLEVAKGEMSRAIAHRFKNLAEVRAWSEELARPEIAAEIRGSGLDAWTQTTP